MRASCSALARSRSSLNLGMCRPVAGSYPAESAILPSEVQVQDRAVALVSPVVNPFDGDGLVGAVNRPVAGQGRAVVPAPGVVKAPVFRDAQGGVAIPLYGDVPPAGGGRGDFQNEVRGLALLRGDVAVAVAARFGVDVEGDEQVRVEQPPGGWRWAPG